jgi:anti-sigma factor RsiW
MTVNLVTGTSVVEFSDEERNRLDKLAMKCTAAQARLAMLEAGILDQVESAIDASEDVALKIAWEYGTEWRRDDPRIANIATSLGLSPDDVDALFVSAASM